MPKKAKASKSAKTKKQRDLEAARKGGAVLGGIGNRF